MKLSVVIPLYNEEDSFPVFFPALVGALSSVAGVETSYVLVNDGSSDDTQTVLEKSPRNGRTFRCDGCSRTAGTSGPLWRGFVPRRAPTPT